MTLGLNVVPANGAVYRSIITGERCHVVGINLVSKRVLISRDGNREWHSIGEFNATWRANK